MDHEFKNFPLLTTSLFGGLFSGFLLGFVNLIYDLIYRGITHYSYSKIINALSIILFSVLLLVIAGLIYFFLAKYVKKGSLLYSALCIAATIFFKYFSIVTAVCATVFRGIQVAVCWRNYYYRGVCSFSCSIFCKA